ncbi:hypothetical protein GCM10020000_20230 [Streptomyces olivoverticillatus]
MSAAERVTARGALRAVRLEQHLDVGGGARLVDVLVLGDPAGLGGLAPPARVAHGLGEGAHGPLGGGVGRYPDGGGGLAVGGRRGGRGGQRLGEARDLQVDDGHGLGGRGLGDRFPQRARQLGGRGVADPGNGGDDDGVAGPVGEGLGEGGAEVGRGGGGGQVAGQQRPQAVGETGVVGEQGQGLGIAEDGHAGGPRGAAGRPAAARCRPVR